MSTDFVAPSEWLPEVLPYVPGCPDIVAEKQILNTVEDFCRQTRLWEFFPGPITTVAAQASYDVIIPDHSVVVSIQSAFYKDIQPLIEATMQFLDAWYPGWHLGMYDQALLEDHEKKLGDPSHFVLLNSSQFWLYPTPNTARERIQLRFCLAPAKDATSFPQFILTEYQEAITQGALARILSIPGKRWSGLSDPRKHRQAYLGLLGKAKAAKWLEKEPQLVSERNYFAP